MTTRVQPQRFTATQTAPASGARLPGELWSNTPDLQIGFIDASKNPQKLVAVRYFSATANYAQGDFVINAGALLAAKSAITAGAFNATQWTQVGAYTDGGGPYLAVSGGAMTGLLVLSGDPTANLGAATKQYVDTKAGNIGAGYVPLTGATMSGPLVLPGPPTTPNQAATKAYVDTGSGGLWLPIAGGTMTGKLVLAIDPTNPLDAVTKEYADEFLPLAGGTMGGALLLNADPLGPMGASTKQYVDSKLVAQGDNRLINGDMRIDQRNGGASGTAGAYTVDRWLYGASQANKGTWQRVTLPSGDFQQVRFGYCLNFTANPTGYASVAADAFYFSQPVEAEMIGDLVWGASPAAPAVLSFWVSSTLTGQFGGSIRNYPLPSTRSFPFVFNIPAASTWVHVVIPIPPDIAGAWVMQGNAAALGVVFDLGSGSNWQATPGGWLSGNYLTAPGCVSMVGAGSSNRFNITAVKLEIGATATPYPHQSPARNVLDCQRYYCSGVVAATGYTASAAPILGMINFPEPMRITPAMTQSSVGANNVGVGTFGPTTNQSSTMIHNTTAAGYGSFTDNWTASAEL